MNIRQLRDLAIKFIGLSCLSSGVIILSQIFSELGYELVHTVQEGAYLHSGGFLLMFALATLLYAGLAYLLLFRSNLVARVLWREEDEPAEPNVGATLEMGVALVGLYHIPNGLYRVAANFLSLASNAGNPTFETSFYENLLAQIALLAIAILCIVKSKAIAAYIRKCAE